MFMLPSNLSLNFSFDLPYFVKLWQAPTPCLKPRPNGLASRRKFCVQLVFRCRKRTSDAAAAILVKGLFSASQKERRLCGDRDENRDLFTNYYRIPNHPYSLRIHYQKIRGYQACAIGQRLAFMAPILMKQMFNFLALRCESVIALFINTGKRTEWSPIRSVIIRVIAKRMIC